jgi:hypothetical protein
MGAKFGASRRGTGGGVGCVTLGAIGNGAGG